jgi:hypothetical protein
MGSIIVYIRNRVFLTGSSLNLIDISFNRDSLKSVCGGGGGGGLVVM